MSYTRTTVADIRRRHKITVQGTCYNVTVNYGSKPQSTNQVLTWLGNFEKNKLLYI